MALQKQNQSEQNNIKIYDSFQVKQKDFSIKKKNHKHQTLDHFMNTSNKNYHEALITFALI